MPHSYCKSIGAGGWMERVSYDCQERPPSSLAQYQKSIQANGSIHHRGSFENPKKSLCRGVENGHRHHRWENLPERAGGSWVRRIRGQDERHPKIRKRIMGMHQMRGGRSEEDILPGIRRWRLGVSLQVQMQKCHRDCKEEGRPWEMICWTWASRKFSSAIRKSGKSRTSCRPSMQN